MRSTVRSVLAALALAATLPLAAPATAQKAPEPMGQLTTILPEKGSDGAWEAELSASGFAITNRTEADAVRYYYVNAGKDEGQRTVHVNVSVEPRGPRPAMAGLLYGFDPATKSYFMLVVDSGQEVSFIHRGRQGLKRIAAAKLDKLSGGPYRLAIAEEGDKITLSINGKRLGSLSSEALGEGATGIIAAGLGTFAFSDFSIAD